MQFLKVDKTTTLEALANVVRQQNVEDVLHLNELKRTPYVGRDFCNQCANIIATAEIVPTQRKISLLNRLASDSEVFEKACLMGDMAWKVMSAKGTFPNMMLMPDSLTLSASDNVIGGTPSVSDEIYRLAIDSFNSTGSVDPAIFSDFSTMQPTDIISTAATGYSDSFEYFKIPWGEVTLYSSLSNTSLDIPAYPEQISDSRSATYTNMPDLLYQYEPWQIYNHSGPRQVTYDFHVHRDMWNGNHTMGGANKLIRFCQANCYPKYNGSAVNTATVSLLIHGSVEITGVLTNVGVQWGGPIGQDGWYLDCHLSLTIIEVASRPLNYDVVSEFPIIG